MISESYENVSEFMSESRSELGTYINLNMSHQSSSLKISKFSTTRVYRNF